MRRRAAERFRLAAPTKLPSFLVAHGPKRIILGTVLVIVVALAEEIMFRGYLLLWFRAVTHNVGIAGLPSSVIVAFGARVRGSGWVDDRLFPRGCICRRLSVARKLGSPNGHALFAGLRQHRPWRLRKRIVISRFEA
jgi:Type II CAAX prenyl endopeptidase Rce1-like